MQQTNQRPNETQVWLVFVDWAHKEEKLKIRQNGKFLKKMPDLKSGDKIITENIPMKIAQQFLKQGIEIYRCNCHVAANYRKKHGLEKSDDIDAKIIEELYNINADDFDRWHGTPNSTALYRLFMEIQKTRIGSGNRQWIFADNDSYNKFLEFDKEKEKWVLKEAEKELQKWPIYTDYLANIRGIGTALSLGLIGIIANKGIGNFKQASSLRHYMGIHPIKHPKNGMMVSAKYFKGVKSDFDIKYKSFMLKRIGDNLIKQNYFYKEFYDKYKHTQLQKVFDINELKQRGYKKGEINLSQGHADKRARRRMVQLFLDHLWCIWRQLEGFGTRSPFPIEKLGHTNYIDPSYIPESLEPFDPFKPGRV